MLAYCFKISIPKYLLCALDLVAYTSATNFLNVINSELLKFSANWQYAYQYRPHEVYIYFPKLNVKWLGLLNLMIFKDLFLLFTLKNALN